MKRRLNQESAKALRAVRPELADEDAQYVARAVAALIVKGAEAFPRLNRDRQRELLLKTALAAVLGET